MEHKPEDLPDVEYTQSDSNIIGGNFSEYFTPSLVREMKFREMCDPMNNAFAIARSLHHKDTQLAQCLTCGGRGFIGLKCQKCLVGVYNLCLGFCFGCKLFGVLGTNCSYCRSGKFNQMNMKCLNPRSGTVYTYHDMAYRMNTRRAEFSLSD